MSLHSVSREVMRKFSPRLLVVVLSDVEVAHFGSYALHVAGIRTGDRLAYQLWQEIQATPNTRARPRWWFCRSLGAIRMGQRPTGSSTIVRTRTQRDTWMMALGAGVEKPQIVERPIRHVDVCATLAGVLGCPPMESQGARLMELRGLNLRGSELLTKVAAFYGRPTKAGP